VGVDSVEFDFTSEEELGHKFSSWLSFIIFSFFKLSSSFNFLNSLRISWLSNKIANLLLQFLNLSLDSVLIELESNTEISSRSFLLSYIIAYSTLLLSFVSFLESTRDKLESISFENSWKSFWFSKISAYLWLLFSERFESSIKVISFISESLESSVRVIFFITVGIESSVGVISFVTVGFESSVEVISFVTVGFESSSVRFESTDSVKFDFTSEEEEELEHKFSSWFSFIIFSFFKLSSSFNFLNSSRISWLSNKIANLLLQFLNLSLDSVLIELESNTEISSRSFLLSYIIAYSTLLLSFVSFLESTWEQLESIRFENSWKSFWFSKISAYFWLLFSERFESSIKVISFISESLESSVRVIFFVTVGIKSSARAIFSVTVGIESSVGVISFVTIGFESSSVRFESTDSVEFDFTSEEEEEEEEEFEHKFSSWFSFIIFSFFKLSSSFNFLNSSRISWLSNKIAYLLL